MRNLMLATVVMSAAGIATIASSAPAVARDYPWCVRSAEFDYNPDCSFTSFAQCMASASGRPASCYINPRFAYERPRRGAPYHGGPYGRYGAPY